MDSQQQADLQRLEIERKTAVFKLDQAQQRLRVTQDNLRSGAEADVQRYMDEVRRADEQIHRLMEKNK